MSDASKIVIYGDSVLTAPTEIVNDYDSVTDIIDELWAVVTEVKGAGLSANQLGYSVSVAVINNKDEGDEFVIINPVILETFGDPIELREGCLSIPGVAGNVKRYASIKLSFNNEFGELTSNYFVGRTAHIIQHEIDHLNGKLYIDHYGKIRRDSMIKKHKNAIRKATKKSSK